MQPDPVRAIDRELAATIRGVHRVRWAGVATLVVVVAAAIAVFSYLVITQSAQIHQSCAFFGELGTIDITPPKGAPPPGRLGVQLQAHSRDAYAGMGCTPALPRPLPELAKYARIYRIPLNH